ncbi:NUDIX hydrolase [Alienimonas californiensis]|uniref:GDP-mannose pyrophosphatase n=1 Tax=Alienimonas californiensis TaxID=2527989 RepID=A0A517PAF4_9PLAN|nr:NUDIX hydrolase [Alienimonas californiensis]QDT16358.1 ADP-ribose pyrophosphatase [Alienimonas californiensis]
MSRPSPDSAEPADRLLHAGKHLELRAKGTWEYAHRPNASAIVALFAVHKGHLICVEQERAPVGVCVLEVPAGLVGDTDADDVPAAAAGRELEEETGYKAETLEQVAVGPPSAGLSDEVVHFFKATNLTRIGDGGGVDGEEITVHRVPLHCAEAWIAGWATTDDRLVDPKVWAALWFLRDEPCDCD